MRHSRNLASTLALACVLGFTATTTFAELTLAQTDSATTLAHPAGGGTMDTGTPTTTTDSPGGAMAGTHRDSKKMHGKKGNRAGKKAMGKDKSGTADAVNDKDATNLGQ